MNIDFNSISIEPIVGASAATSQEDVFSFDRYEDRKSVAAKILAELNNRFVTIKRDGKPKSGFCMEDGSRQIGLLSQCHSLQSMVSLAQDFGLDFTQPDIVPKQKGTIRELMDIIIEDVLETVCIVDPEDEDKGEHRFDNAKGYVFDTSPYNSSCFSEKYSDVNSITWVITSFLLILRHHAAIHEVCKWEKALVNVIRYGLQYLIDAFIEGEEGKKYDYLEQGWNFTKNCIEPSLYFSYTVCECYLDVFETFKPFLEYLHAVRNHEQYFTPINPDQAAKFEAEKLDYEKQRNRHVDESKREARYDEYNELARVYRLINGIDDHDDLTIDGTLYGQLEERCKRVAKRVWDLTKKELAEKFYYNDLQNTVTEQEIRMSTTSDVLFNTVYIVNIMLCSGLDETIELERSRYLHLGETLNAEKSQQDYDNLLESCMLTVQKAFRTYDSLKNVGKEYIVDQFLVGFNENFDGHEVAISELRKLRMRAFSLLPLLIHTNNKVCEYLVKYPHYNMGKYHQLILDNRLVDKDDEKHWIWERDGFFSGSNYYFVLALKGFYEYYEKYEQRHIEIGKDNAAREQRIRDRHEQKLRSPEGAIGILQNANKEQREELLQKDERIAQLEAELRNVQRPIEDAVRGVVADVMQEQFAPMFAEMMAHAVKVLTVNVADNTADDAEGTYGKINSSLHELLVALMISRYVQRTRGIVRTPAQYEELKKQVDTDFINTIVAYVTNLSDASDGKSELLKLLRV